MTHFRPISVMTRFPVTHGQVCDTDLVLGLGNEILEERSVWIVSFPFHVGVTAYIWVDLPY